MNLFERRRILQSQSSTIPIDYLGFDGTQYIDTLITPLFYPGVLNFKIEYRSYCPMYWGWVSQQYASNIWIGSYSNKVYWTTWASKKEYNGSAWHTYIFDANTGFYVDGVQQVNFTASVPSATAASANSIPLYIGSAYDTTSQTVESNTNINLQLVEYVKIWINDVLVRDFTPVISGGIGYFYDRVSGGLFGNLGTGNFLLPESINNYVQIEYLQNQNDTAQYIDTLYTPTPNTKLVLDAALNDTNGTFAGLYNSFDTKKRFHIGTYKNQWHFGVGTYNAGNTWINFSSPPLDTTRHTFVLKGDGYCSLDSTYNQLSPNNTSVYDLSIYIFNTHLNSGMSTPAKLKVYSVKIYEADTITMNLIPCRDSNNIGYMYDTVSKRVFENEGTSQFILGPDVNN